MLSDAISTILCLQPIKARCKEIGQPLSEDQMDILIGGLLDLVRVAKEEVKGAR